MSDAISQQHPAVVLRSHYVHLRTLLVIAMIAIVALAATVVVLATRDDSPSAAHTAAPVSAPVSHATISHGTTRYDGGPEEGTRGPNAHTLPPGNRYDGGPVGGH
jgi:hypothetical protein